MILTRRTIAAISASRSARRTAAASESKTVTGTLFGGLIFRKPLLAMVFDQMFHLTDDGWRKLTVRWALFFLALAILNEIVWRTQSTDTWVTFKVFGPQSSAPSDCSGGTTVGTASVSGNASYSPSAGFTPGSVGDYWWFASYGGDSNNTSTNSGCGARWNLER